jgi:TP901 family phage tail tape measure protein
MALNLGDLFFQLGFDTAGLKSGERDIRSATRTLNQATAATSRFLNKAELKEAGRGADQIRKLRGQVETLRAELNPTERAAIRFARAQRTVNEAVRAGVISQRQGNVILRGARSSFDRARVKAGAFTVAMQDLTKSVQIALGPLSGVAARITAFTGLLNAATARIAFFVGGTIGLAAGLVKSIGAAEKFEASLVGVAKTTNLTDAEINRLGKTILGISGPLATGTEELLNTAQAAGQLGIQGTDNLLKFTEVITKLGTASDLVGEDAAKSLARLVNVTTTNIDEIEKLGDVIVALGNSSAATEKEINKIAVEVGQATAQFGISAFEAEAFGAALASIGARAELSGSVIGRAFRAIDKSIREGGRSLELLSKLTGIAAKDMKEAFAEAPAKVFKQFIDGLGNVDTETASVTQALEAFGLKGEEINKILPSLAVNSSLLGDAFETMGEQIEKGGALTEEFVFTYH